MVVKEVRSGFTLSAKPCIVTPLATRTPIAAIFRSPEESLTQTPERPSMPCVDKPKSPHTAIKPDSISRTNPTNSVGLMSLTIG